MSVVFDRYDKADSIKEGEHVRRVATAGFEVKISGPNTPVPKIVDLSKPQQFDTSCPSS